MLNLLLSSKTTFNPSQIQISNITEDTGSLWVTHIHTEAQLRNEMEILNTITEDLRLKDWEHSTTLKNLTILEGDLRHESVDSLNSSDLI